MGMNLKFKVLIIVKAFYIHKESISKTDMIFFLIQNPHSRSSFYIIIILKFQG